MGRNSSRPRHAGQPGTGKFDLKDAIELLRPSVCQVALQVVTGKRLDLRVLGSAFAVAPAVVLTAKHVADALVEEMKAHPGSKPKVGFAGPNVDTGTAVVSSAFSYVACSPIAADVDGDLALLRTPDFSTVQGMVLGNRHTTVPIRLAVDRPDEGEPIACSGYPLAQPSLVSTSGHVASAFGNVSARLGGERYLADLTANPGNSGGPVYRVGDGRVVGVLVAGLMSPHSQGISLSGLARLTPSSVVATFMKAHGLTPNV